MVQLDSLNSKLSDNSIVGGKDVAKIVNLDDYRGMKQREFFINLYRFLNKNMDYSLDHILAQLDDDFIELSERYGIDPLYVNFFRVPIVTFIVITFVNNSDIKDFFADTLSMENDENKAMFKNTLIKIIESFAEDYYAQKNIQSFEAEIEEIIDEGFKKVLGIVPEKIVLV